METALSFIGIGEKKAALPVIKQFVLGIMAGMFIALASQGSSQAIHTIESVGIAKTLAGALFTCGLVLVVVAGGELFTGNCLMIVALLQKKIKLTAMLRSWLVVYLGNFAGSLLIAALVYLSGQFNFTGGGLGGFVIKTAVAKINLNFGSAFFMGVLCNILVCAAVWMAAAAKDIAGKVLVIFFPIWLFITSGFEHSVANMYYISAGIFAAGIGQWEAKALEAGVTVNGLDKLGWPSMLINNLLPVTLGNIVGGAVLIGVLYWLAYLKGNKVTS
jgi:formate/nitrite transporter